MARKGSAAKKAPTDEWEESSDIGWVNVNWQECNVHVARGGNSSYPTWKTPTSGNRPRHVPGGKDNQDRFYFIIHSLLPPPPPPPHTPSICTIWVHAYRGLAVMRPACHLDTQNTVFWQFGHPKVYVRICWRWLFLEDRGCRSCSVTFIRHTKQYLA